jgi:PAS domain S-box-containing protein
MKGNITGWNKGAEKLFSFSAEEMIGSSIMKYIPKALRKEEHIIFDKIVHKIPVEHYETKRLRKDGKVLDVSLSVSPVKNEIGGVIGAVKIVRDLTTIKQIEDDLARSREKYKLLFDSIDEGFAIIELLFSQQNKPLDLRFIEVNDAYSKLTGLQNVTGKRLSEIIGNNESELLKIYAKICRTGKSIRINNYSVALDRWYDVFAMRLGKKGQAGSDFVS